MPAPPPGPPRPNLRQRLEFRAARALMALPGPVQRRLAGGAPRIVAERVLHPQMQLLLALSAWLRAEPAGPRNPADARRALRYETTTIAGPPVAVGATTDIAVATDDGAVAVRHYAPPAAPGAPPLLVYYHGGGFVIGDLDSHDGLCRRLCRDAGIHVVSVDYRLAPEHPYPAAVNDAVAAFRWARAQAGALGARPDRIAVGGDSAGGNLAAVVAQQAAADHAGGPCMQLLLYPVTDRTTARPSLAQFGDGYFLSRSDIDWYHLQYTGRPDAQPDPGQNPLCARDFTGLAPALVVTAGFDPLHDEGKAYADALRQAGVPVVLKCFEGLLHGFASMATISPACDAALDDIILELRTILSD